MILLDTGPLVALIDRRDAKHSLCVATARRLPRTPLVTTWPCLTEAAHLLARAAGQRGIAAIWKMRARGELQLYNLQASAADRVAVLMDQYQNVPMDLADATLVAADDELAMRKVFTLDSDFRIYRLADGSPLDVIP